MQFRFSSFSNDDFELELFTYELTIDKHTQTTQIRTSPFIAKAEFISIVRNLAQKSLPCKIKVSKMIDIWSQLNQAWKQIEVSVEFANNACESEL